MIENVYFKQAELLLRIIPFLDKEAVFALKGGTAINFFVMNPSKHKKAVSKLRDYLGL